MALNHHARPGLPHLSNKGALWQRPFGFIKTKRTTLMIVLSSPRQNWREGLGMSWVLLTFKSYLLDCMGDCIPLWSGFSVCPESHHFPAPTPGPTLIYKVPLWKLEKGVPSNTCCPVGTGLGEQFETSDKLEKEALYLSEWKYLCISCIA